MTDGVAPYLRNDAFVTDSREQAVDWLAEHVKPGQKVLLASELSVPASERARIPGQVTVAWTVPTKRTPKDAVIGGDDGPYDVVVVGHFSQPAKPEVIGGTELAASFGTDVALSDRRVWLGSDQRVEIRTRD